jgi:hypothetical protein
VAAKFSLINPFSPAILRIVAIVWLALVTIGSLQPARPGVVRGVHREIHWIAFSGGSLLLLCLSRTRRQEIVGASAMFLLGVSLEVLQHLIYLHQMEWRDIADDGFAILIASAHYYFWGRASAGARL